MATLILGFDPRVLPLNPESRILNPLPRGFTLLEVLVALGMSVLLVTAIYSAISMYIRVSTDDATVVERSRVARALFRQMALDIQSVTFRVEEESTDETATESTSTDTTSTDTSSTSTETTESTTEGESMTIEIDPAAAVQTASVGLIGDATKLTLHISRPARDMAYATLNDGLGVAARTSDLLSVTYFLASTNGSGLEGEVGQRYQQQSGLGLQTTGPQGLGRLAGDRMAIEFADLESDTTTLADAAQLIAPEVVSLEFRYFDGLNWLTEWDSVSAQRLPNAVEITIGMKRIVSEEERLAKQFDGAARADLDAILEYRRHVVSLPLAEPFVEAL
jgi:prepilin-type N-terminal cleavage/methylation domain-containing protein